MPTGNGQTQAEQVLVMASALVDRVTYAARHGLMYGGERKVWQALGWTEQLTWNHYRGKYDRQDIAGRIVDLPVDGTWREGFGLKDDDDPDTETAFERSWLDLDRRLKLTSWMARLDRVAGIGEYAALYLGLRGQAPETPLRRARANDLVHVTVFAQPGAAIGALDDDPMSERFGLPESYVLSVAADRGSSLDLTSRNIGGGASAGRQVKAHWSRIIHAAEAAEETKVYGRPKLQRVYNLLDSLQLVVGATAEGYWRSGARARYHLDVDKDFAGSLDGMVTNADGQQVTLREYMGEELDKLIHGLQDFIRTSGTDLTQLGASTTDPRGAVDVIIDLIAAATGIPKRILIGSERGELASDQDAREWAHRVDERQRFYAEPVIVRPLIDRLVDAGVLAEPTGGEYEVEWPDITGPTQLQQVELAERVAKAEASHGNAKLVGGAFVTDNEMREMIGRRPVEGLDESLEAGGELDDEAEADDEVPAASRVLYNPDQPRDPAGTPTGGRWTKGGGPVAVIGLTPSEQRAFTGEQVETETKLSKLETGKLGESVAIAYMKSKGHDDAAQLNTGKSNFPIDVIGDHELVEVKTGLVSNGRSAQQWRATIGQPGIKERNWMKSASPEAKRAWNREKSRAIIDRKTEVLREYSRSTGKPARGKTVATIIDPDRRIVDVFEFDGFHLRVGWRSEAAEEAYIGSFSYAGP